ncbi:VCAN [Branchiostoma lanceolatum]|uniref:VCAN protein n=1 Tax=Branchiostoma lanceolatum TaxID=7740 RepID=A0A8K0ELL3_BRALA|nr:VCAN [Branchiostoma lanceolatum]
MRASEHSDDTQATPLFPAGTDVTCGQGWYKHGSRCFRFFENKLSYRDAKDLCASHGAHLALPKDREANWLMMQMLRYVGRPDVWIGLTDVEEEGTFVWDDGEELGGFSDWKGDEPNNRAGGSDCVRMIWATKGKTWTDQPCSKYYSVICEKDLEFPSAKFTTLGATGHAGPTSLGDHYRGQDHEKLVTLQNGIQLFTVPETGNYRIKVAGAAAGWGEDTDLSHRGRGALVAGTFELQKVQEGVGFKRYGSAGGGGGTFVTEADDSPLIIAGGGGGGRGLKSHHAECDATTGSSGQAGFGHPLSLTHAGGRDGRGATRDNGYQGDRDGRGATGDKGYPGDRNGRGATGGKDCHHAVGGGGGGGGLWTDGGSMVETCGWDGIKMTHRHRMRSRTRAWANGGRSFGGYAFVNGGQGGRQRGPHAGLVGGFGGGGVGYYGGGGGGGYSGGAMGINEGDTCGGGGGSFNSGRDPSGQDGANNGPGYVVITKILM